MKKTYITTFFFIASISVFSQVGVNIETPRSTFDIETKNTDGTTTEGILIPRLTAEAVKTMTDANSPTLVGVDQHSILVFITEAFPPASNAQHGKYAYIDDPGYYYYDSHQDKWMKLLDSNFGYTAGQGMLLSSGEFFRTGLEEIWESGKTGWRLIGADSSKYGDIGRKAMDLSYSYGYQNNNYGATGDYSFASGSSTTASGLKSTAMGAFSRASGDFSFAVGRWSTATATGSVAIGGDVISNGANAHAIGNHVTAQTNYSIVLGYNNFNTDSPNASDEGFIFNSNEELLVVGNGESTITSGGGDERRNALIILRNAKTGIGLSTDENTPENSKPTEMLDVNGNARIRNINNNAGSFTDKVVVADANGVLKTVTSVSPTQFYMPSIVLPTSNSNLPSYVTYDSSTEVFTVDLHGIYESQFSNPVIKSNQNSNLVVYSEDQLDYFIVYSDDDVYQIQSLSEQGVLKYKVGSDAAINESTYMNIVFKIK